MRSDVVAEQVSRLRKQAGLTREQLAARCADLGWPALTFGAIGSIETGRRDNDGRRVRHVTVEERDVLAAALGVPSVLLEVPLGESDPIEVLPGLWNDAWTAYRWLVGEFPTERLGKQQDPDVIYFRSDPGAEKVNLYRQHQNMLYGYLHHWAHRANEWHATQALAHLTTLASTRVEMHRRALWLPPVPDGARDAMRQPLLDLGYEEESPGQLVKVTDGSMTGDLASRWPKLDVPPGEVDTP